MANFVEGHSPLCTFCVIGRVNDIENESCSHLFYDCPFTENMITEISTWMQRNELNQQINLSRNTFFGVPKLDGEEKKSKAILLMCKLLMKYIWDCKLRKILPRTNNAITAILMDIDIICGLCRKWNNIIIESGLNLRHD